MRRSGIEQESQRRGGDRRLQTWWNALGNGEWAEVGRPQSKDLRVKLNSRQHATWRRTVMESKMDWVLVSSLQECRHVILANKKNNAFSPPIRGIAIQKSNEFRPADVCISNQIL
jgi:hypothetical protein